MTEVLHFPSSPQLSNAEEERDSTVTDRDAEEEEEEGDKQRRDQLSLLALLVTVCRKSLIACKSDRTELCAMEIGWPTNVRHVAHVTFDRFNGFLGLPVEFEPEVSRRAPSASANVFGVSSESMQLSYDARGNSVPTILLLMQSRLYAGGGLQAEGIFRINAENSQEEDVRDQLNRGLVPVGIDVHCLAGLIKAWFRELPTGILDPLSPEQVMQCQTEAECAELVTHLPPSEAALLDWAINLMADVVQQEHLNKMNARNIAMVFAPNMTQMADPLTALMYAVQVMNFLKTLIIKTLREREDYVVEPPASRLEPSDENGHHQSPSQTCLDDAGQVYEDAEKTFITEEPLSRSSPDCNQENDTTYEDRCYLTYVEKPIPKRNRSCDSPVQVDTFIVETETGKANFCFLNACRKTNGQQPVVRVTGSSEKTRGISNLSRVDSRTEHIEAWC